jgi:hypothetical protein
MDANRPRDRRALDDVTLGNERALLEYFLTVALSTGNGALILFLFGDGPEADWLLLSSPSAAGFCSRWGSRGSLPGGTGFRSYHAEPEEPESP